MSDRMDRHEAATEPTPRGSHLEDAGTSFDLGVRPPPPRMRTKLSQYDRQLVLGFSLCTLSVGCGLAGLEHLAMVPMAVGVFLIGLTTCSLVDLNLERDSTSTTELIRMVVQRPKVDEASRFGALIQLLLRFSNASCPTLMAMVTTTTLIVMWNLYADPDQGGTMACWSSWAIGLLDNLITGGGATPPEACK